MPGIWLKPATLAGAEVGSGQWFRERRVAVKTNIPNRQATRQAAIPEGRCWRQWGTDTIRASVAGRGGLCPTRTDDPGWALRVAWFLGPHHALESPWSDSFEQR